MQSLYQDMMQPLAKMISLVRKSSLENLALKKWSLLPLIIGRY